MSEYTNEKEEDYMQSEMKPADTVSVASKRQPSRSYGKKKKDAIMEEEP